MLLTYSIPCRVLASSPSGAGPLNITKQLISLEVGNQRLDNTGLIKTSGTLTLAGRPISGGIGESLDPRVNPSRWALGARLDVQIWSGSAWVPHPRGALRILQNVKPSAYQEDISIEVGCDLSYLDSGQAAPWGTRKYWANSLNGITTFNESGDLVTGDIDSKPWYIAAASLPQFQDVGKTAILNALGAALDAPLELLDDIGGQFNYLRNIEGSIVAQMGAIAYSQGFWLWMDGSRQLRAASLNLTRLPDLILNATQNGLKYEVLVGNERPAQDITASAPSTKRANFKYSSWFSNRTFETPENENESLNLDGDQDDSSITTEKSLSELFPLAIAYPLPLDATAGTMVQDTETETENTYIGGWLVRTEERGKALKGTVLPNLYAYPDPGSITLFDSSKKITDYEIINGAIKSIRERTYEPGVLVFANGGSESLVLSRSITRAWEPYKDGWLEITTEIDHKAGTHQSFPRFDSTTAPPAPTAEPQEQEEAEGTEDAQAVFDDPEAEDGGPRKRLHLSLKSPVNDAAELAAIAAREGAILYGRSFPAQWAIPLPASYLENYTPLSAYRWAEPAGLEPRYIADSEIFVMDSSSSTVAAEGLLMGIDQPDGAGGYVLAPPYTFVS